MVIEREMMKHTRYQLLDTLGQGAMGIVYKAFDRLTQQTIALKRVLATSDDLTFASLNQQSDSTLALALEFRVLAGLRHPHIVVVLDYGFDEQGQPFYTMPLIEEAQTVLAYGTGLTLNEKVHLLTQILQALIYLHRRGIIHRDLKPANVLVTQDKSVQVMDFGLALHPSQSMDDVASDGVAGTLAYMAPELFSEAPASVQSDLYAVGIIAYELFVGQHPFNLKNMASLVSSILMTTPDTSMLTADLATVIDTLLDKDLTQRYRSAHDVISAFCAATQQPMPPESASVRESFLQASTFVGRETELSLLKKAFVDASAGQGSAWLIGGESGIGKSRLLDELRIWALVRGAVVLRGQAVSEGGLPYQLWRDILRRLILSVEVSDFEAGVVKAIVPDVDTLLTRSIVDVPPLDTEAAVQRLALTIADLFKRQTQPIVLILEDLHWLSESLELLKPLNAIVKDFPWLIIGSYRNDERADLPDRLLGMQTIQLARLSEAAIADLSAEMLGEAGKKPDVIDLLMRETEGNAFFMVEVVRALAEEAGALSAIGQATLPHSIMAGGVQAVIRRRLDHVPPRAQTALKLAAIAGRQLDSAVMRTALPNIDWEGWLTVCAEASVLEVTDGVWRFSHDKLREALVTDLSAAERARFHHTVAEALEEVYPNHTDQAAILAYHWHEAGVPAKEVGYALLAGEQAYGYGNNGQAVDFLRRGLSLWDDMPPERQSQRTLYEVQLGDLLRRVGAYQEAHDLLQGTIAEARQKNDQLLLAKALHTAAVNSGFLNAERHESLRQHEEAITIARLLNNEYELANMLAWHAAFFYSTTDEVERPLQWVEEGLHLSEKTQHHRAFCRNIFVKGHCLQRLHRYEDAVVCYQSGIERARELGDRQELGIGLASLGDAYNNMELADNAYPLWQEALKLDYSSANRDGIIIDHLNLASYEMKKQNLPIAWEHLVKSLQFAHAVSPTLTVMSLVTFAGWYSEARQINYSAEWIGFLQEQVLPHEAQRELDQLRGTVQAVLSADEYESALQQGKAWDINEVITRILDTIL